MRKFNGGDWTESRFNSFVKSALRAASRKWPPKYETINDAFVGKRINVKSGREAKHYTCAECKEAFPLSDIQVDHINAIIDPTTGFISWDETVNNMFCEKENLQVLCKPCHKIKTAQERAIAKESKKNAK